MTTGSSYTVRVLSSSDLPILTESKCPMATSDTLSESLLATVSAPSATNKHKTLQLHNPDILVELKFTGTLTFKWGFQWEE